MTRSDSVARIRARLRHPIVDTDGQTIEYLPALRDELATLAGAAAVAQLDRVLGFARIARSLAPVERRLAGLPRLSRHDGSGQNNDTDSQRGLFVMVK